MRAIHGILLSAALLLGGPASAATADGSLFLTDERLATSEPGEGPAQCPFVPTYAMGPATAEDGKAYVGLSYGVVGCHNYFTWTADGSFVLEDPTLVFFLGCDAVASSTSGGVDFLADFLISLTVADTSVFSGGVGPGPVTCSEGDLYELSFPLETDEADVDAGDEIVLSIVPFYTNPAEGNEVGNLYYGTGQATPSRLEGALPSGDDAPGGAPTTTYEELTDGSFSHGFVNEQDNIWHFNYTTDEGDLSATYAAEVENGTAHVVVMDADGETVFDVVLSEDADDVASVSGVPGQWTIRVTYDRFIGSVDFTLGQAAPAATGTPTTTGTSTGTSTDAPTGTETDAATEDDQTQNESPGIGLPVAAVLVASALIAWRRRLR